MLTVAFLLKLTEPRGRDMFCVIILIMFVVEGKEE
jgi:hypothetical protein